jgi:ankyrin repeat protein
VLLEKGANVNIADNKGKTALTRAQEFGKNDIAQLLRQWGGH